MYCLNQKVTKRRHFFENTLEEHDVVLDLLIKNCSDRKFLKHVLVCISVTTI